MKNGDTSSILDMIYETRSRGFESKYIKTNGKLDEIKELENLEEEIKEFIEKRIEDKKIQNELLEIFNRYQDCYLAEMIFWNKEYYKNGFIDGSSFARELQERIGES